MTDKFVLDACSMIAFLYNEDGGYNVKRILEAAQQGNAEVYINKVNALEVYYNIFKAEGAGKAEMFYQQLLTLPIMLVENISDDVFKEAGRLKANYKMSLADALAVGEAVIKGAAVVTSDHHEFDVIESNESIKFEWIR